MINEWLHHPLMETLGWTLLHSSWELTAIAVLAGLVLRLLRGRSANARYVVGAAAMLLMAAAPMGTFAYLRPPAARNAAVQRSAVLRTAGGERRGQGGQDGLREASVVVAGEPTVALPAVVAPAAVVHVSLAPEGSVARVSLGHSITDRWLRPALPYAVIFYLAGLVLFSLRLLMGYFRLAHLGRTGMPDAGAQAMVNGLGARLRIARPTRLLQSALVEVPTVLGAFRPVILVPVSALTGLTAEQLSALLAHELAHVRRHDYLANLLQSVIEAFFFYHPAMWWLSARVRTEREHCCDDIAATLCSSPVQYAAALTQMETLRRLQPEAGPVDPSARSSMRQRARLALSAAGTALVPRVRRLLGLPRMPERAPRFLTASSVAVATIGVAAFMYVISAAPSQTAKAADEPKPAKSNDAVPAAGMAGKTHAAINTAAAFDAARGVTEPNRDIAGDSAAAGESEADQKIRKALDSATIDLMADQQAFSKIMEFLASSQDINLVVDYKTLEAAGINRDTPVSVNLKGVPFRKALTTVLHEAGGPTKLDYSAEEGVLTVTTKEEMDSASNVVTKVYDIRDLLVMAPKDVSAPPAMPSSDDEKQASATKEPVDNKATRKEMIDSVVKLLESVVSPDSWRDNGGSTGTVVELDGQLIIVQSRKNHEALAAVLGQLREGHAVQIGMEARIMVVDAATLHTLETTILAPQSAEENGTALKAPKEISQVFPTPDELAKLLDTLKGTPSASTLSAPRVTLFNGQKCFISITDQQNIIRGYNIKNPGTADAEYKIDVGTISPGLVLTIDATTTADRKYVVAKFILEASKLERIDEAPAPNVPADKKLTIQKPVMSDAKMEFTASIPDDQILVAGGGKLPEGMAFPDKNAGEKTTGDRYLLLLIHPKIILQKEVSGLK